MRFSGGYRYNCVSTVKAAGYAVPRTLDGYARTIPVTSTALPKEGEVVVIKTSESWMGHVAVAKMVNGQLVSVVDSVGKGRIIPLSTYQGQI